MGERWGKRKTSIVWNCIIGPIETFLGKKPTHWKRNKRKVVNGRKARRIYCGGRNATPDLRIANFIIEKFPNQVWFQFLTIITHSLICNTHQGRGSLIFYILHTWYGNQTIILQLPLLGLVSIFAFAEILLEIFFSHRAARWKITTLYRWKVTWEKHECSGNKHICAHKLFCQMQPIHPPSSKNHFDI